MVFEKVWPDRLEMSDAGEWRHLVSEALLEFDPVKLRTIIDACQAAIVERLRVLKYVDNCATEREELFEGIRILRKLQVERLHYPVRPAARAPVKH